MSLVVFINTLFDMKIAHSCLRHASPQEYFIVNMTGHVAVNNENK